MTRWYPPSYEEAAPDFWEFPERITALETIGDETYAILEDGRTVRITDLISDRATKQ